MNKKGLMLETLIRVSIAIALVILVISVANRAFSGSNQALSSFNRFANSIDIVEDGERVPVALRMDRATAIIGFAKDANEVAAYRYDIVIADERKRFYFERPRACGDNEACVCLCRKGWTREETLGLTHHLLCEKELICEKLERDFVSPIMDDDFGLAGFINHEYRGGFIFERPWGDLVSKFRPKEQSRVSAEFDKREKIAYIENFHGMIGVCFDRPSCINEGFKQKFGIEQARQQYLDFLMQFNKCTLEDGECEFEIGFVDKGYRIFQGKDGAVMFQRFSFEAGKSLSLAEDSDFSKVSASGEVNIPSCDNKEHRYYSGSIVEIDKEKGCIIGK